MVELPGFCFSDQPLCTQIEFNQPMKQGGRRFLTFSTTWGNTLRGVGSAFLLPTLL